MYNFTTTTVINTQLDLTTGLPLWSLLTKTLADGKTTSTLHIKRLHNFNKDNVVAIYKAEGNYAELAKVCLDLNITGATAGDIYRLNLNVGLTLASLDSRYSNDMIYKGFPLSIEFIWKGTATLMADNLIKLIKKYQLTTYGEKLFNIDRGTGTTIVISAKDEFLRFRKVNIELLDPDANHGMGEYSVIKSLEDLTEVDSAAKATSADTYFVGKEAFADYNYITRNLRLPTPSRTYAFATLLEENPIPGALYNLYTIHYCTNRGLLGLNAVGDTVKSVTTHVLFINQNLLNVTPPTDSLPDNTDDTVWSTYQFETALEAIAPDGELIEVPSKATVSDKD